jgi:chromosome segregation ATPase
MTPEISRRAGLHPSIVLSAYIEALVRGRRVAILGDAMIGLADELVRRGARLVHAYDPDTARTSEALARATPGRPHQVSFGVLADDLGVRDGAFDLVLVPDVSLFPEAADVIRRARRLVAPAGAAVFVAPNTRITNRRLLAGSDPAPRPGLPGYYELFDLVSLQFAKVKMVGQAPFVGYTVVDFAAGGDPEVNVDTSLLASSEEPEHFIAIGSDRSVSLDAFSVVELPWAEVSEAPLAGAPVGLDKAALDEARERLQLTVAELEKLREQKAEQAREAEGRASTSAALSTRVVELERELEARDARFKELEARAGDSHVRAERLTHQIRDLEEELARQRDRATRLSKQLDDEKRARQKAELELGMNRGLGGKERIDQLTAELEAARVRVSDLELEVVETQRRAPAPRAEPAPDPKLLHRLNELEQAVNAALREAADAAAQRDAAIDRARKLDARVERAIELEGALQGEREARASMEEHARVLEVRLAETEQRLTEERRRRGEIERHTAEADHRRAEAERRLEAAQEVLREKPARAAEVEEHAARAAQAEARVAALEAELGEARGKLAAEEADRSAAEALAAEIAALEGALRDRGRVVASLSRDLRESERVGRELLAEVEEARSASGAPAEEPSNGAPELRARLDALAASAARSEADLQAATWRIAQLERELADARRGEGGPPSVQIELEQALAAARDEVASLRRALGGA